MPPLLALLVLPLSFRETSDRRFSAERHSGPARGFAADARPQERQGRLTVEKSVGTPAPYKEWFTLPNRSQLSATEVNFARDRLHDDNGRIAPLVTGAGRP